MISTPYMLELRRRGREGVYLERYKANRYSQNGEDGVLLKICELLSLNRGLCVEFGAHDGISMSNCRNLLLHHNWTGVMIEGDLERFKALESNYEDSKDVLTLNFYVSSKQVSPHTLEKILQSQGVNLDLIDLVSIDVDSIDYHIFNQIQCIFPAIYVIEFNPTIANDIAFVQADDSRLSQGCSLLALTELAKKKGYELAVVTGANGIFVREDLFNTLGISDNSIDNLYTPFYDGRIFCGFDSYIHTTGLPTLHWSNTPVSAEALQLHPRWRS